MKRKNIKLLSFFVIGIFPIIIISSLFLQANASRSYHTIENNSLNNDINDNSLYAITNGLESQTTITFKDINLISWINTKYANEVTEGDLEELLILSSPSASIEIVISEVTATDIQNGIVRFEIFQSLRFWTNGISDPTKTQRVQLTPGTGQGTNNIWQTPASLVLSQKFRFAWASSAIIESFVNATTKKFSELTKDDVLNNLIDNFSILPTIGNINVRFSDLTGINNSGSLYGVGNIEIIFNGTNNGDWVDGNIPSAITRTLIIRGLTTISNNRATMELSTNPLVDIRTISLDAEGKTKFNKEILSSNLNPKFGDLFASQFISIPKSELINVLFSGLYAINKTPIVSISYMGINIKDANFSTLTGISNNLVLQIKITDIEFSINDSLGSLSTIYNYDSYDVFSNSIISKKSIQLFPPNTFRLNVDSGKNLEFSWKEDANSLNVGTSYDVVNNFVNNKNNPNPEYLLNLSSYFFDGSIDVYNQPRKIVIDYVGGGSDEPGQGYISTQPNQTEIKIDILFNTWNGAKYIDEKDQLEKYGFYTSKVFDLKQYQYNVTEIVTWTTQTALLNSNPILSSKLPSDISNQVFNQTPDDAKFITESSFVNITNKAISDSLKVIFYPNDINGTIEIKVYIQSNVNPVGSDRVYSRFYTGFLKSAHGDAIFEFGWIPQIDVSNQLLSMNTVDVAVSDVIQFYLKDIPLFANFTLSATNVVIDEVTNDSLRVSVTMPFFNQDQSNSGNTTFRTVINGFNKSLPPTNESNFSAPNNFTMIIAVSGATFVIILLSIIIIILLFKTISIKKIKQIKKVSKKHKNKRNK